MQLSLVGHCALETMRIANVAKAVVHAEFGDGPIEVLLLDGRYVCEVGSEIMVLLAVVQLRGGHVVWVVVARRDRALSRR